MGAAVWLEALWGGWRGGFFLLPWCSAGPPGSHGHPFRPRPGPEDSCEAYRHVLGQNKVSYEVPRFHGDEERFFVEGLSFPDASFTGLVSFHVTLLDDSNEVGVAKEEWGGQGSVLGGKGSAGMKGPRPLHHPAVPL